MRSIRHIDRGECYDLYESVQEDYYRGPRRRSTLLRLPRESYFEDTDCIGLGLLFRVLYLGVWRVLMNRPVHRQLRLMHATILDKIPA